MRLRELYGSRTDNPSVASETMNPTLFGAVFGGQGRFKALRVLFEHPKENYGLLELATASGADAASLSRWLKDWEKAGLVTATGKPRAWRYQLTPDPALEPLLQLFRQGSRLVEEIKAVLNQYPEIEAAIMFGSMARGEEAADSDVDVLVIGDVSELRLNAKLKPVSREFGRPINASVYSREKIEERLRDRDSFLLTVLRGKTMVLKGSIDAFEIPTDLGGDA